MNLRLFLSEKRKKVVRISNLIYIQVNTFVFHIFHFRFSRNTRCGIFEFNPLYNFFKIAARWFEDSTNLWFIAIFWISKHIVRDGFKLFQNENCSLIIINLSNSAFTIWKVVELKTRDYKKENSNRNTDEDNWYHQMYEK